jgi:hypothetical protein
MTYPIEIKIDDPHAEVIEEILSEVEWHIKEIRDSWNKTENRIVHTADLDDLLAGQRAIAIVWDIQHVKDQRPDLNDEQAWAVLQECRQDQQCIDRLHDAMREMIVDTADKLHPQQRPPRHAKAAEVIAHYAAGDDRENLVDLLTDTMHFCQSFGEPFDAFCDTARVHFDEETKTHTKGA